MYKVLIIGAGNQGCGANQEKSNHKIINFAHAIKEHSGFKLIGFVDNDLDKARLASRTWGGNYTNHLESLLKFNKPHVVIVTTPDDQHYEILKELADYKVKLVICEKPLAVGLKRAQEIVELYKLKNIPLMVDNTRNFIPCLRDLKKEHGKAVSGYCLFNRGWFHTAVHAIGFFRMFNLDNYRIKQVEELDFRVWVLSVTFEDGFIWSEERITNNMPVPEYYNHHMRYVIENAYNFLKGKDDLNYNGKMAVKDIEMCYKLIGKPERVFYPKRSE